jgi:predicted dehydrogenase
VAVFCQKPLGRSAVEVAAVVGAARASNRLLGVDLSYRFLAASQAIRAALAAGEIGEVYAVSAVFHNAYGPDKSWFYDPVQSGGGCVIDLGIHLIDLVIWTLGIGRLDNICAKLFAKGVPLAGRTDVVEDYAFAHADLPGGGHLSLDCSWNLPAGCDAVIGVSFYGSRGGLSLRNVNGSFYDFIAERLEGTSRRILAEPPDDWGGRAAVSWAQRLAAGEGFDPRGEELIAVAEVLDTMYGR